MRKSWFFLLAVLLVFVCVTAFADELSSETSKTIDFIVEKIFYGIGLVIAWFVTKIVSKLASKYGIQVSERQKEILADAVNGAISYAEEWARKKIKVDKLKVKSIEKFDRAVKKLCEKVPVLTEEQARDLIVSALPRTRGYIESIIDK